MSYMTKQKAYTLEQAEEIRTKEYFACIAPATKNNTDLAAWANMAYQRQWGYVWGSYGLILSQEYFENLCEAYPSHHVGIYIGNGYVIQVMGIKYGVVKTKLEGSTFTNWFKTPGIEYPEN